MKVGKVYTDKNQSTLGYFVKIAWKDNYIIEKSKECFLDSL